MNKETGPIIYVLGRSSPGGFEEVRRTCDIAEAEQWVSTPSDLEGTMNVYERRLAESDAIVPDLYRLAFMPGCFCCPKCNFQLSKVCWNPESGEIGTREEERQSEPCPNDGTMLVHMTYREQVEIYADRLKEEFDRFDAHTKAVADFLNELWAIMVDPLADGVRTVKETMEGLKKAALEARELQYQKQGLGNVRRIYEFR